MDREAAGEEARGELIRKDFGGLAERFPLWTEMTAFKQRMGLTGSVFQKANLYCDICEEDLAGRNGSDPGEKGV